MKALPQIAEKGDERAIAGVLGRLEHEYWGARQAAVEALPLVAEKGDERAIAGLIVYLAT